jgi:hypothetical protein
VWRRSRNDRLRNRGRRGRGEGGGGERGRTIGGREEGGRRRKGGRRRRGINEEGEEEKGGGGGRGEGEGGTGEKGEVRWRSVRVDSWSDRRERWLTALYIFICIFSAHNLYLVYIHIMALCNFFLYDKGLIFMYSVSTFIF